MDRDRQPIAVIGGGFTGMMAALRLAQSQHSVELFERSQNLGGLASGFEMHGTSIERTYHHIFRTDSDMIELVDELGIGHKLKWYKSSLAIFWAGRMWPFSTARDLLRFTPLPFLSRMRLGLVGLYLQRRGTAAHFGKHTALSWMRRSAGEAATDLIWAPMLKGKFGRFGDQVSMAWLSARLHVRANSRDPGADSELLGYFDGGFDGVVTALRDRLVREGVRIQTGATIERLSDGHRPSITVAGERREYAAVIATVPSYLFEKLTEGIAQMPDVYREQLKSVQYLGALCMVFSSTQQLDSPYWICLNEPDAPFVVFINHTRLVGRESYDGHSVYYAGCYITHDDPLFTRSDADIEKAWFEYIAKMFPEFDVNAVVQRHITRFRNAQHVVDCGYEKRIPGYATPLRNVYLANFSQIFPEDRGTTFAVREGKRVAALVNASLATQ